MPGAFWLAVFMPPVFVQPFPQAPDAPAAMAILAGEVSLQRPCYTLRCLQDGWRLAATPLPARRNPFALPRRLPAEQPAPARREPAAKAASALPANGAELHHRLRDYDAKLAKENRCHVGALLSYVAQAGAKQGYGEDISTWNGPAISFAVDAVKEFDASLRSQKADAKQAA
jgi:hypothetical protein